MFFELHDEHKIGYKTLSDADLGLSDSSHQTHIGLSESVLTFLNNSDIGEGSVLIYENSFDYIDAYFDRIENPDGTFRSPKIRTGDRGCISIVSAIRTIVNDFKANKWFLLWFGLKNEKIVFFLFNNLSDDYKYINSKIDLENRRMGVLDKDDSFNVLVQYLESKINKNGELIIKELEVISQVDDLQLDKRFRKFDIDKANEKFKETGRLGESLVDEYLHNECDDKKICHYVWHNKEKESSLPYDFTIQNIDGSLVFLDVKTTSYDFDQPLIFSDQEVSFIANTNHEYCIYRVYMNKEQSYCLKICNDSKEKIAILDNLIKDFKINLIPLKTDLKNSKFSIAPTPENFNFKNEIPLVFNK